MGEEQNNQETPESVEEKSKKTIPPNIELIGISDSYLSDLECIREMFSHVLPLLQKQDKDRSEAVTNIMERVKKKNKEFANNKNDDDTGEKVEEKDTIVISGPDLEDLMSNLKKINRAVDLFKQQSVVSLISRFDEFLGQFLTIVLRLHPEWLSSSDKTITYKELVKLESIEKAVIDLIQKEVENILRGSHEEQIKFIDDKLKLGIKDTFLRINEFLEVAERRNLFVHTGGKISQQYIDRCRDFGHKSCDLPCIGEGVKIDNKYFDTAFSLCFEIGLRISQAAIRRLFPEKLIVADRALNHLAIKFLNSSDFHLAETICEFDLGIPEKLRSDDSEFLYFAKINRAIAQKFAGKDFNEGLKDIHWGVFHPKYQLAIDVLNDEYEKAASAMRTNVIQESVGEFGFRTWPLFRKFRNTKQFLEGYFEIFEKEYIPDPEKDIRDQSIADGLLQNETS